MAQTRSEWAARKLQRAANFTQQALSELTDTSILGVDVEGRDVVRVAAMPKTAIYQSQGLAFIHRRKKGALLSHSKEHVVLICKKATPDGGTLWSGPIFLKGKSWGAGLTLGWLDMRICLALMNSKGMGSLLRPHHNTGVAASFCVDMNGSRIRRLRTSSAGTVTQVKTDASGGMQAKYYLLEACILDLSCNGGKFGLHDKLNRAVYGDDVDVQAVLECRVAPPPEFQPVYDLLNDYVRTVKREHRTLTLARDRSMRDLRTTEAAAEAVAMVAAAAASKNGGAVAAGAAAGGGENGITNGGHIAEEAAVPVEGRQPGSVQHAAPAIG